MFAIFPFDMIKPIDIIYDAQQSFESTGFVRAGESDAVIMHGLDSTSISATCGVYSYRSTSDTEAFGALLAGYTSQTLFFVFTTRRFLRRNFLRPTNKIASTYKFTSRRNKLNRKPFIIAEIG